MDQLLNYDIEKLINSQVQQIKFIEQNNVCDEPEKLEILKTIHQSILEIKNNLLEKNFKQANTYFALFKNKVFTKTQNRLIEAAIDFYRTNPELDYPADYQAESEHAENLIKQVESPSQNIDQINFDKLMAEITDIKALSSEFKNLQSELKNITDAIKESTDKQTALKPEKVEAAPSDANLAPKIELLVESVDKLEPFLKALTDPILAYTDLKSNMDKHIKEMNDIVTKNVESSRDQFQLAISGDVAKIKTEIISAMQDESKALITQQSAILDKALETQKTLEETVRKHNLYFFYSAILVLLISFVVNLGVSKYISNSTVKGVINYIEQIKSAPQSKTAPAPTSPNHKKS